MFGQAGQHRRQHIGRHGGNQSHPHAGLQRIGYPGGGGGERIHGLDHGEGARQELLNAADVVLTYDPTVFSVSDTDVSKGALLTNPPPSGSWTRP